ncbi:MAG: hypothetical protein HZB55_05990 [Deltaproteobacteria bacterium]|nr:hypothetical protein [Deltaproteobacteria bacterium]
MSKRRFIPRTMLASTIFTSATLLLGAPQVSHAALERVGPVDAANGGYPAWYQDKSGLTLDFGLPQNQAELNGGWLLILPGNLPTGAVPEVPFTNYSPEHFYWNATAGSKIQGGMSLVLSMEGAFGGGAPLANDQITFGRVRIKIASIPTAGDYKVYTPFGVFDFPGLSVGDRLFFTQDVGITCGTNFSCALNTSIGPFLLPSPAPGGPEVPPIPDLIAGQDPFYDALAAKTAYPGTGRKYIADPARLGPLTGGTCALTVPTPTVPLPGDCIMGNAPTDLPGMPARPIYVTSGGLRDPNIFRVEVNGVEIPPSAGGEHAFSTAGRVFEAPITGRVTVDRASYGETAAGVKKLDVFVTAFPTMNPRLPAGTATTTSNPDMGYYDTACGTDAAGNPTAPTTTGVGGVPVTYFQMFRNSPTGNTWWGQNAPLTIPSQVCVLDNGRVVPGYFPANVTDEADILGATYTPSTATLTVDAVTSDCFTSPQLTLDGFGAMTLTAPCTHQLSIPNLFAPPARVSVTSLRGGTASLDVRTTVGTPVLTDVVVTNADSLTMNEDCSATPATSCVTPPTIDVLANDTLNGAPVAAAAATLTISAAPVNGTATVSADQQIVYTPKANYNGPDLVGYRVTVGGTVSAEGYLHVTIAPVNDVPTAINDASGAPNNKAVTINLIANDTDPDGVADLAAAVIQTLPAAGATIACGGVPASVGTACAGGTVTFTGSGGGSVYTFSYKARDVAGGLSANTATVTVTVNATEAILIAKSIFTNKTWRWTVTGTDSIAASQTLAIRYDITTPPTYKANGVCTPMTAATNPVIGTATVDALGNWSYDVSVNSAGTINPTNTGSNGTGFWCSAPKAVLVTSPLGATRSANIQFK